MFGLCLFGVCFLERHDYFMGSYFYFLFFLLLKNKLLPIMTILAQVDNDRCIQPSKIQDNRLESVGKMHT